MLLGQEKTEARMDMGGRSLQGDPGREPPDGSFNKKPIDARDGWIGP